MTVSELLSAVVPKTDVRVRTLGKDGGNIYAGKTGLYNTERLLDSLAAHGFANAYVTCVYPLFHAQELYIECVKVLD